MKGGSSKSDACVKDNKILDWACEFLFKQGLDDAAMEIILECENGREFRDSTLLAHLEEYLKAKQEQLAGDPAQIGFTGKEWKIAVFVLLRLGKKQLQLQPQLRDGFSSSVKALFTVIVYNLLKFLSCSTDDGTSSGGSDDTEVFEAFDRVVELFGRERVFVEDSDMFKAVSSGSKQSARGTLAEYFESHSKCVGDSFTSLFSYIDTLRKTLPSLVEEAKAQPFLEVVYKDINNGLYAPSAISIDDIKMFNKSPSHPQARSVSYGNDDDDDDDDDDSVDKISDDEDDGEPDRDKILRLIRSGGVPKYSLSDMKKAFPNPTKDGWVSIEKQTDKDISEFKKKRLMQQQQQKHKGKDKRSENKEEEEDDDSDNDDDDNNNNGNDKKDVAKLNPSKDDPVVPPRGGGVRRPFSEEEEKYLIEGVKKYGEGKWSLILTSYPFVGRTNVNLKDKWRNMQKKALREKDQQIFRLATEATKRLYPQYSPVPNKTKRGNGPQPVPRENDSDIFNDDDN